MTKRQWIILQQALLAYRIECHDEMNGNPAWDEDDGAVPTPQEIDDLASIVCTVVYQLDSSIHP